MKLKLHLPSTWYICDSFLFHIEIERKCGWIIGGGGGKGYVGPPLKLLGAGPAPPPPLAPPSSYAYVLVYVKYQNFVVRLIDYKLDQLSYSEISARNLPTVCFLTLLSGLYGSQIIIEIYTG